MNLYAVILAAGKGTRMKSHSQERSKVGFEILGKPILDYVLDALFPLNFSKMVTIVGHNGAFTEKIVNGRTLVAYQHEQLGTGHAVMQAKPFLENEEGVTLITCGDTPLFQEKTLRKLIEDHISSKKDVTILTAILDNPHGYGRIVRGKDDEVYGIVEQSDATPTIDAIKEVNTGVYVFNNKELFKHLNEISGNNAKKEYYLTDIIAIFRKSGLHVGASILPDAKEMLGINDRVQLAEATAVLRDRINRMHMLNGVTIIDPNSTYIGPNVKIGADTIVFPGNYIIGNTIIGEDNVIKSNNFIEDATIGDFNQIGPMTNIRPLTVIEGHNRIGSFVETKKATMKKGAKAAHLTYLGDAIIGEETNIGGGTITANYDGKHKFQTIIGNHAFIGTGATIIAPITIGDGAFIAGGSTIYEDVGEDDMAFGRAYQANKKGYAKKRREKIEKE